MINISPTPKTMHIIDIISFIPIYFLGLETFYIYEQLFIDKYYVFLFCSLRQQKFMQF